ncbi:uncharacterized protein DUF1778 [Scandinavium goeteborgense]|uniref:Uncharacterized protein DUF1778 n=1 Tax=Scandinavium goeteborgense TaxID=1851514 RepID=A0A4R6DL43_SCAGO|nr:uncharacterized protein DUF1778 [Scandinavium goeteborgense]
MMMSDIQAENVILDRRMLNFDDKQYADFIDMLDAPVTANPPLNTLLARKPQWENNHSSTGDCSPP